MSDAPINFDINLSPQWFLLSLDTQKGFSRLKLYESNRIMPKKQIPLNQSSLRHRKGAIRTKYADDKRAKDC